MLSNRKLTYNKVYVDSQKRLPQSESSSDFIIQMNENLETHPNTVMYVMDEVIPQSYYTTPEGFYQFMYVITYNTSGGSVQAYLKIDLKNQVFFASQLVGRISNLLSQEAVSQSLPSNLFTSSYDSDQRRMILNITDNAYSFKVPTDKELQESTIWSDNILEDPMSVNNLMGNYEATVPTNTTWTSGLMNLNPFNSLFIVSTELSDFHYSAPDGYSNSIIKKVNMMLNVGGITVSQSAPLVNDWIDVSNRSLKRLRFRITDARGKTINLHNAPVSFTLLFVRSLMILIKSLSVYFFSIQLK